MRSRLPKVDSPIEQLEDRLQEEAATATVQPREPEPAGTGVFLVHGHDVLTLESVRQFVERVTQRQPIVLADQPGRARTIIEKFEAYGGTAAFAVILMTGDDVGGPQRRDGESDAELLARLRGRARQNVVLELGYFIALLRKTGRLAVLYEPGLELPSDIAGVEYIELNEHWQTRLARELREAGIDVDLNRVL